MQSPYYTSDGLELYCDDCLKILQKIDDNQFDLVIADPPFNLGKDFEENLEHILLAT